MTHLKQTAHLTQGYEPAFAKILTQTHAGQAHFAGGFLGATCAMCVHYGCYKQVKNAGGEIVNTSRVQASCAEFKRLTGRVGPAIPSTAAACKYFTRKEPNNTSKGDRNP